MSGRNPTGKKYEVAKVVVRNATTQEVMNVRIMTRDEANQFVVFWRIWNHNPDSFICIE